MRSGVDVDNHRDIFVEMERKEVVASAIGTWAFSAHDFTDDELLYGALLMLKHALKMPEVEEWGMTDGLYTEKKTGYPLANYFSFRRIDNISPCQSHSLQRVRTLPQFSPCRRCPTGPFPFLSANRHIALVPDR